MYYSITGLIGFIFVKDYSPDTAQYFVKKNISHLYPKGKNLFTKSVNVKPSKPILMSFETLQKILQNCDGVTITSVDVVKKDGDKEQIINTIAYINGKRKD